MALLVWLNERSHPGNDVHPSRGEELMADLVRLLRAVRRLRADAVLVSAVKVPEISLGSDYSVARWCNRPESRDDWRYLRAMENRAPFSAAVEPAAHRDDVDYELDGARVEGIGGAHLHGGMAVSFATASCWEAPILRPLQRMLVEGDDGDPVLREATVEVQHAGRTAHVETHGDWLRSEGLRDPHDGRDLWERRGELLPHLEFLPRVEAQLRELLAGDAWVQAGYRRLREISTAVGQWDPTATPEPAWECKITPESEGRRRLCWFTDLDGEKRCFDLHARMTPGCGRIHFRLDAGARRAIVAHVGRKLGE